MYPQPNTTGVGYNYITEQPSSQPQIQDLIRIDYNLSSKWRAYGRYVKVKNDQVLPYGSFVLGTNLPDYNVLLPNPRSSYAVTVTGSLSPTTILEATIGGSHNSIDINPANKKFNRTALGLTGMPVVYPNAVQIDSPPQFVFGGRIANAPNIGSNNSPFYNFNTTRDWSGTISKVAGQHTVKAGDFLAEQLQAAELLRQQQRPVQLHRQHLQSAGHRLRLRQRGARDLQPVHPGVRLLHRQVSLQQRRVLRARTTGRSTAG